MPTALTALVFLLCAVATLANAQTRPTWGVEVSGLRWARVTGMSVQHWYPATFVPLSEAAITYAVARRIDLVVTARRTAARGQLGGGLFIEDYTVRGGAAHLGARFTPRPARRFQLAYGIDIFAERTRVRGFYGDDAGADFNGDLRRTFTGVAPTLLVNYRVAGRVYAYASARARLGYTYTTGGPFVPWPQWISVADRLGAAGVRVVW